MNKIKATKKEMRQNYRILSVGYCDLQHLLAFKSPVAYSTRAEGWACDYYDIEGVIISTGYSPIASKNVKCNYGRIRYYDEKAGLADTKDQIDKIIKQFIDEIIDSESILDRITA